MIALARARLTAHLLAESGITVTYEFNPSSAFKWRAELRHPVFKYGRASEMAQTLWGLNFAIRGIARRVLKAQPMQSLADQMTKDVTR